ncbi:polysaccharide pyruvyl transferase family protein [Pelotomaculum isophthalicicum JI]|uniref:Polysaccharide pyruvyl transferase family protein n=1 Tax=Pelotomaculum isophthalicicum JI TaxID=947010 RepID=A0A9X4H178_9FIRM|nr:polysaccharide pyruvyl transferase family protein [Pelotomaculum isophthalicicum]MDF9407911.1 polysaccharide pyruvyl transferase family protein [Pelotomaculum isophthalicicum JI]
MMGKKVVIAGYYGFNNIGDEAVLNSMLNDMRFFDPNIDFVVLSDKPEHTESSYKVRSVSWRELDKVIQVIENCDLLIIGGGGLFNSYLEYDGNQMLSYNNSLFSVFIFSLPLLAALLDKPCMIYAIGASNFNSSEAIAHARMAIELADICTVRDPVSVSVLRNIGCCVDKVRVTADPAFRLQNVSSERVKKIFFQEDIPYGYSVLGVVLRNWDFYGDPLRTEHEISKALKRFSNSFKGIILFIPFDTNTALGDLSNDKTIIARMKTYIDSNMVFSLEGDYTPSEISSIIANCDLVLGMRLHSCIFSIKNYVPVIGLVYDQKVKNIMDMAGMKDFLIDIKNINADNVYYLLQNLYNKRKEVSNYLLHTTDNLKKSALENAKLALEIVNGRKDIKSNTFSSTQYIKKIALKQTKNLIEIEKKLINSIKQYWHIIMLSGNLLMN